MRTSKVIGISSGMLVVGYLFGLAQNTAGAQGMDANPNYVEPEEFCTPSMGFQQHAACLARRSAKEKEAQKLVNRYLNAPYVGGATSGRQGNCATRADVEEIVDGLKVALQGSTPKKGGPDPSISAGQLFPKFKKAHDGNIYDPNIHDPHDPFKPKSPPPPPPPPPPTPPKK